MSDDKFRFMGWWTEEELEEVEDPWEIFHIHLYGEEAGDVADTPEDIQHILDASGYEIILRKKKKA